MSWMNANFPSGNDDQLQTHRSSDGQETAPITGQNGCLEIANSNVENSSRTKRRKLTSKVWKEFTKCEGKDGKIWAICKHCKKKFDGSSKNGTTHLNNHFERCQSSKKVGPGDTQADERGNSTNSSILKGNYMINPKLNELDSIRVIIKYGFCNLNFIKPDILLVYQEEKEKLRSYLSKLSCRFSLAIRWVEEWCFMVIHYIDDNWKLKQKTISCHSTLYEDLFLNTFKDSLEDWKIVKNICSVVTDEDREEINGDISRWLTEQSSFPLGGQLLSARCLANFLKSRSWRTETHWEANKIGKCLDYIRNNKQNFQIAIDNAQSVGKKVISRFVHRYYFGLEKLEIAVGYKEAFCELEDMQYDFKSINLTKQEWENAVAVYELLKKLNDIARSLLEAKYTTANVFFPKFCELYMKLRLYEKSGNHHVREIALCAKENFVDKYWCNSRLVLAIAVVLDPRFKMDIVELWYREIYGILAGVPFLNEIIDALTNVYDEYAKSHSKMLDEMGRPCASSPNSELLLYLKEPKIPPFEEFDILAWWRLNSSTFPILARMARDFLAVPISPTDFGGSTLHTQTDNVIYCFGLDDDIKQALICTKSWLKSPENICL